MIIWLIAAIWFVALDRKYIKAGGVKTGRVEMILWSIPVIAFAVYMIFMMVANHQYVDWDKVAYSLGAMTVTTFPAYLCLYECRRWYIQYRHPLQKKVLSNESSPAN